jgi:bacterioferritin
MSKMEKNKELISELKSLLENALTAINQFMVHSEMCENLGYGKLHLAIQKQALDEMRHAEWLIERIIFLDGSPSLSKLNKLLIGKTLSNLINTENGDEPYGIKAYNNAIKLANEADDSATADLLNKMLKTAERYIGWAATQREQIKRMGMDNYLVIQTESLVN